LNGIINTNNKSALTKQFKTKDEGAATNAMTMTVKASDDKAPDEPPEGSWWTKVPLGCAISKSIHSCSRVRNKHLAASYC